MRLCDAQLIAVAFGCVKSFHKLTRAEMTINNLLATGKK